MNHLAKDGRFAFESRNPVRRAWLSWTPDQRKVVTTQEHGRVEEFHDTVADGNTGIVDVAHHYRLLDTGNLIVGHSRLRFVDQNHLTRLLTAANLTPIVCYGDWDRSPLNSDKPRNHRCDQPW